MLEGLVADRDECLSVSQIGFLVLKHDAQEKAKATSST